MFLLFETSAPRLCRRLLVRYLHSIYVVKGQKVAPSSNHRPFGSFVLLLSWVFLCQLFFLNDEFLTLLRDEARLKLPETINWNAPGSDSEIIECHLKRKALTGLFGWR